MLLTMQTKESSAADAAIQAIVEAQSEAWNRNDAAAWARDFTDDATFINVRGDLVRGRAGVERIHAFIFSGPYKGTHYAAKVESIMYPAPSFAIATVTTEVTNFTFLPPGLSPTAPGVLRTRFTFVLTQRENGWKILSAQNTAMVAQSMEAT